MVAAPSTNLHLVGDEDSSNAGRSSKVPARSSDLGFDGASMARSPAPPASPREHFMCISTTRTGCSSHREEETLAKQGGVQFRSRTDVTTTLTEFGQAYIQMPVPAGGGSPPHGDGDRRGMPESAGASTTT